VTRVAELIIGADPGAWRAAGFDVAPDATTAIGGVRLRFDGTSGGLVGWVLGDAPDPTIERIDGLRTTHAEPAAPNPIDHPNGVTSIDHIVVYTPDLERTCAAVAEATGAELRRIREAGSLRQGFHRLGDVIVEVVTFPQIAEGQAMFWGLALNVGDIDAMFATVGPDAMSVPKDAVQPGRRIASFKESAGLGLPVAVMTPHPRATRT
jgi:hypothetical protein